MTLNFATILHNQGLSHIAINIIKYLSVDDVLQFSLVSRQCSYLACVAYDKELKKDFKELKGAQDFFTYFGQWTSVFEYFEDSQCYYKSRVFIDGLSIFHQKCRYIWRDQDAKKFRNYNPDYDEDFLDYEYSDSSDSFDLDQFYSDDSDDEELNQAKEKLNELKERCIPVHHPIHYAIFTHDYDFLKVLIDSPADFNATATWDIITPLIYALRTKGLEVANKVKNRRKVIKLLIKNIIKKGIELNPCFHEERKQFMAFECCKYDAYNFMSLIKFMVSNPTYKVDFKQSIFLNACQCLSQKNEPIIHDLIKHSKVLKLDLNAQDENGRTGFHLVLTGDPSSDREPRPNIEVIKTFFKSHEKYGINIDKPDNKGFTPFLTACQKYCENQDKVIELFMQYKDKFNFNAIGGLGGHNALELYISNIQSKVQIANLLTENCKPHMFQSLENDVKLLHINKFPQLFNRKDWNIFHYLCKQDETLYHQQGNLIKKMGMLAESNGPYINSKDDDGNTPLHLAIKSGNRDALLALLKHSVSTKEDYPYSYPYWDFDMDARVKTKLHWKDGFQAMVLLLTCTPENCCSDSEDRFEAICEIIKANKLDISFCKQHINVKCPKLKIIVDDWLSDLNVEEYDSEESDSDSDESVGSPTASESEDDLKCNGEPCVKKRRLN